MITAEAPPEDPKPKAEPHEDDGFPGTLRSSSAQDEGGRDVQAPVEDV